MRRLKPWSAAAGAILAGAILVGGSPARAATELAVNGGFEDPAIPAGTTSVVLAITGWTTAFGPGMELQNNAAGSPFDGAQLVELDSTAPSGIYQDIPTAADTGYLLRYAYSARPGNADNKVNVLWDGAVLANLSADGTALADTDWQDSLHVVTASGAATRLQFDDASLADGLGGYIDGVSVEVIDFDSVRDMVNQVVTKKGIAHALIVKLNAAERSEARGNEKSKAGQLKAFRNQVRAQTGKSISAGDAALLIQMVDTL